MAKIDKAIQYLIDFADDDTKGYSQNRRRIAKTAAEAQEISEGDCSSTALNALIFAGYDIGNATYTGDVVRSLLKVGWKDVTARVNLKTGAGLKAGFIVVRPKTSTRNGHMAMMISPTELVQNQHDYDGVRGDSSGQEIRRQKYYNSPFTFVLAPPAEIENVCPYRRPTMLHINNVTFRGEDAKWVIWHLIRLGYTLSATSDVAGPNTWEAIHDVQLHCIGKTGSVWTKTYAALEA